MIRRDEHLTRQARHSRVEKVYVTDATLFGYVTEDCVVINFTNQDLIVDTNQGHHFTIPAHSDTVLTGFLSGKPAIFSWQAIKHPRREPLTYQHVPILSQQSWHQGRWHGFRVWFNSY
jgi:hypothetical protein